jgi:hypothetical protein
MFHSIDFEFFSCFPYADDAVNGLRQPKATMKFWGFKNFKIPYNCKNKEEEQKIALMM